MFCLSPSLLSVWLWVATVRSGVCVHERVHSGDDSGFSPSWMHSRRFCFAFVSAIVRDRSDKIDRWSEVFFWKIEAKIVNTHNFEWWRKSTFLRWGKWNKWSKGWISISENHFPVSRTLSWDECTRGCPLVGLGGVIVSGRLWKAKDELMTRMRNESTNRKETCKKCHFFSNWSVFGSFKIRFAFWVSTRRLPLKFEWGGRFRGTLTFDLRFHSLLFVLFILFLFLLFICIFIFIFIRFCLCFLFWFCFCFYTGCSVPIIFNSKCADDWILMTLIEEFRKRQHSTQLSLYWQSAIGCDWYLNWNVTDEMLTQIHWDPTDITSAIARGWPLRMPKYDELNKSARVESSCKTYAGL
jgi:hypothetical protein